MLHKRPEKVASNITPTLLVNLHGLRALKTDHFPVEALLFDGQERLCEQVKRQGLVEGEDEQTYPGPNTPNLDGLHPDALARFRVADEAYFNATSGRHLQIESGFRTVYRQAELYTCWRLGEAGCNPADIPGASIHNSGLAIDVRNARDQQVIDALDNNGWDRTVMPREPWHWEPVGLAAHTAAVQRRQRMRQPDSIARRWQTEWEAARTKNDQRNDRIEDFNQRVAVWQPEWEQHQRELEIFESRVEDYNRRVESHNAERQRFSDRVDRHNAEVEALQRLYDEIQQMEPGPERDRLIREYNRRAAAAQAEQQELLRLQSQLEAEASQLERERADFEAQQQYLGRENARLVAEGEALLRLRDNIETLRQEIEGHLNTASALLQQIAQEVHP